MSDRLDSIANDLAENLRLAPSDVLRSVARSVAAFAVERAGLRDSTLDRILGNLIQAPPEATEVQDVESLVDTLDGRYFQLDDEGLDCVGAFGQARAARSVSCAMEQNPLTAAIEATYEAIMATNDLPAVRLRVESILGAA